MLHGRVGPGAVVADHTVPRHVVALPPRHDAGFVEPAVQQRERGLDAEGDESRREGARLFQMPDVPAEGAATGLPGRNDNVHAVSGQRVINPLGADKIPPGSLSPL